MNKLNILLINNEIKDGFIDAILLKPSMYANYYIQIKTINYALESKDIDETIYIINNMNIKNEKIPLINNNIIIGYFYRNNINEKFKYINLKNKIEKR